MAETAIRKKIDNLLILMEKLAKGEEIYAQNERIQLELGINERTLRRYLEDIHEKYGDIVITEKRQTERSGRRVTVYRVVDKKKDVREIFRFFIESGDDLGWLLQLIHENDLSLLKEYSSVAKESLKRALKEDEGTFQFVGTPFENLEEGSLKERFIEFRRAVKLHEYRTVEYCRYDSEILEDIKCLKLMHMNDNWYLAAETAAGELRLLRLAFITNVRYSKKSCYRPEVLRKYVRFFEKVQNAMTLNLPFKTARLLASADVSIYFEKGMKPFFPTQRFKKRHEDGAIEFTVDYTQPIEITPFIKRWLPDISVLEPPELAKIINDDLKRFLSRNDNGE